MTRAPYAPPRVLSTYGAAVEAREEAVFAARLHLERGTLLSDEAIRQVCRLALALDARVRGLDQATSPAVPRADAL